MDFNIAVVQEAVAEAGPDREVIVQGGTRRTAAQLTDRSRRLGNVLSAAGMGLRAERTELAQHESGQDHLALYLHDGPEFVEGMLGAYKARVAPFNVNYRYVSDELRLLLARGRARGMLYHGCFTPHLAEVVSDVPGLELLIRVDDGSGHPLLPGAVDYEETLRRAPSTRPSLEWSPDDLYVLFTGGTTGLPKGVLWRQADILVAGMTVVDTARGAEYASLDEVVAAAGGPASGTIMVAPPLMHASGQWPALWAVLTGGRAVLPTTPARRDPADILALVERERAGLLTIVGDAFARPLVDELRRGAYDLGSLKVLLNGGAALSGELRATLLELLPDLTIVDTVGSSESGAQARGKSARGRTLSPGSFVPGPGTVVVDDDRRHRLPPGHPGTGWLASSGRIPLGYLDDAEATRRTFPVVEGVRMTVPGDRARHRSDGVIELLGRDSMTINSGGEKIFVEEVEAAIASHPAVADVVVVGRASPRWGQEVTAVVALRPDRTTTIDDLLAVAGRGLARYKLPKHLVFVDRVERSPAGKADYRWAAAVARGEVTTGDAAG